MVPVGIAVLHRRLGALMARAEDGFDLEIDALPIVLRGMLRHMYELIKQEKYPLSWPDRHVEFSVIGTDRRFLNGALFGIADIRVIHVFFSTVIRPTTVGFASSVLGIHH